MSSRGALMLIALIGLVTVIALHGEAAAGPQVAGAWACETTRPGSTVARPLVLVFHTDKTFTYSSQTTVNGGPLALPFTSRGGGHGQWRKIGPSDYAFRTREDMYIDGNAGGFLYVDATIHLDAKAGLLCSGRPECSGTETRLRLTRFVFGADGSITGEVDLLPAGSEGATVCSRLSAVFTGLP